MSNFDEATPRPEVLPIPEHPPMLGGRVVPLGTAHVAEHTTPATVTGHGHGQGQGQGQGHGQGHDE